METPTDKETTTESGVDSSDLFCCVDCGSANVEHRTDGNSYTESEYWTDLDWWKCLDCNESHDQPPYKQNSEQ